jgi:hypothetical protein
MATKVSQKYTSSHNISITKRNGEVSKVTLWQTGVPGSTQTVKAPKRNRRKA